MCGILGVIGEKIENHYFDSMLHKIKHRGPNGSFVWQDDTISFAHARLSIIDLSSNGSQPMICQASGNVLIFNGEIYNYKELKKEL